MIPGFSRSEVVIIYPEQWFANPMTIIPKSHGVSTIARSFLGESVL